MIPTITLYQSDQEAWRQACLDWGFFYLRDHGIDQDLIERATQLSRVFFDQSPEQKNQVRRSLENCWGYYDTEFTKNQRDWKEILDIGPEITTGPLAGACPQMPDIDNFSRTLTQLSDDLHKVALQVTERVLSSLGVAVDLQQTFDPHSSFLRINYYPECEEPASAQSDSGGNANFGIHHHTDAGAVTLLCQEDITSLQMFNNGQWMTIPRVADALIVNLGDIVQVWSNDQYRAPLHRVLAHRDQSRISIPYFLNPAYSCTYQPLTNDEPKYQPINWGEFRAQRTAGDYADQGAEVQISDYLL